MNRHVIRLLLLSGTLGVMGGCSSSSKNEKNEASPSRGLTRFMDKGFDKKKGEFSKDIRSRYDQQTFSAGKTIKDRRYKTDEFNGKSDYNGSHEYKAKDFAQSDKKSLEQNHGFQQADKKPADGDRDFSTKQSRFADDKAREGEKSFAQGDETFKTRQVVDAAKSQKKNTKPLIIPAEGDDGKRAYTEEEVRRMVNRN